MPAEFDQFAANYSGGLENPLKRWLGGEVQHWLRPKIELLIDWLTTAAAHQCLEMASLRLLDVGCGDGQFLKLLRQAGFTGILNGCDVSSAMIDRAQASCSDSQIGFTTQPADTTLPFSPASFDVIVLSAVLHHVPVAARPALLAACANLLSPGGMIVVFEHNPFHPFTRFIVATTEIDRDAILLSPAEATGLLKTSGLNVDHPQYLLFFPPRWTFLKSLERWLKNWPLGGQYAIVAHKQPRS